MSTTPITAEEGLLLNLIESLSRLEWRKYQQRYPEIWQENRFQRADYSEHPPFISFRFQDEDVELIGRLKQTVESYKGIVEWVMIGHKRDGLPGTNWMICPKRLREASNAALDSGVPAGQYMAEHEPEFGPVAYEDLLALTEYLRNIFDK